MTEKLKALRVSYAKKLPDRIKELYAASEGGGEKALRDVHGLAHKLAGSAATYGYRALGKRPAGWSFTANP